MALTPQTLIDDALLLAHPYTPTQALALGPLLRRLTTLDAEIVHWYLITAPERLNTTPTALIVSLATNATGYALSAARVYSDFRWIDKDGNVWSDPISIVPESHFMTPGKHPAGIVRGSTFFPSDPLEKNWTGTEKRIFFIGDGDKVQYRIIAEPGRVTTLSQALVAPDESRDYLQWSLALAIMLQAFGVPVERIDEARLHVQEARAQMVLSAAKRTGVESRIGE